LLLSIASWGMLQRTLEITEYHELQERAEDVQLLLKDRAPGESLASLQQVFRQIYDLKDDGKWLQVLDQEGRWIYRSRRMIAQNPLLPLPQQLPPAGIQAKFHQGTRYVLILAYPIVVNGRNYSVQTGLALNKPMVILRTFGTDLLILTPAALLLAAVCGHFMSRKALEPVAALSAEARRINDTNLDLRLPIGEARDEISHLSQTLNQMLERIDKAFHSVRAFTGNASHELRTPISLLRTEIEVALYRPRQAEEYREILARLHEETIRMTTLVENLLSLARSEGGAETLNLERMDVIRLLQQTQRAWSSTMQRAFLEFHVEVPSQQLAMVGDPPGIARLLSILLENACRYTLPGGRVTLAASPVGSNVLLTVTDTGVGIAPQHLPRIFDRFYRVAQSGDTAQRGSGLGLALAKWIADRHGTVLAVQSEPGRGSCFSLELPLCLQPGSPAVDAHAVPTSV
jgi:heavy metal sensor kinase